MIIKSHIRGGFRQAADYLKEQGENELTRLVEMSDPHVKNLEEAFRAMWAISEGTKVKKPIHHVSINPMKDERLTVEQVRRICERLEERYGYAHGDHQRVIVEHIKEGRQHFHVIWNRVSLKTGKPHWPYLHKKQSKIVAREMEIELVLKRVTSERTKKHKTHKAANSPKFTRTKHTKKPSPRTKRTTKLKKSFSWNIKKSKPNGVITSGFVGFRKSKSLSEALSRYLILEDCNAQPVTSRKRKGGKSGSSEGGFMGALSPFKFSQQHFTPSRPRPFRPQPIARNVYTGMNRRFHNIWVPVRQREYEL